MKFFNILLALLFALFAIVQLNDPDPWAWTAMYGLVAVVSALAAFGIYRLWVIVAGMVICVVWMATLLPDFIHWIQMGAPNIAAEMKATEPYIELTREFLGLFIAGAALAWHFFRARGD
jgi:hypothetical protein